VSFVGSVSTFIDAIVAYYRFVRALERPSRPIPAAVIRVRLTFDRISPPDLYTLARLIAAAGHNIFFPMFCAPRLIFGFFIGIFCIFFIVSGLAARRCSSRSGELRLRRWRRHRLFRSGQPISWTLWAFICIFGTIRLHTVWPSLSTISLVCILFVRLDFLLIFIGFIYLDLLYRCGRIHLHALVHLFHLVGFPCVHIWLLIGSRFAPIRSYRYLFGFAHLVH
jgi:hypothetical protein